MGKPPPAARAAHDTLFRLYFYTMNEQFGLGLTMKIGIIVYSQTGNTLSVAKNIQKRLNTKGHTVSLERIETVEQPGKNPSLQPLKNTPDPTRYDAVIFGSPVHAFSLCRATRAYMDQLPSMKGKKTAVYVTKGLKSKWTGGNKAIRIMKKGCEARGAEVLGTGMVFWKDGYREQSIKEVVDRMASLF